MSLLVFGLAAGALLSTASTQVWAQDPRRSSLSELSPALQAMQRDELQNPGMLWVAQGRAAFAGQCAQCHDEGRMRGVASRYPALDTRLGRPVTLAAQINQCRTQRLQRPAYPAEADEALALAAYLGRLSHGMATTPPDDPVTHLWAQRGQTLFRTRFGQLAMSCAQCHDEAAGLRLAGSLIPQGHPTGYPIYRLEWQGMGSLPRRLRGCLNGVRAEPFADGSDELLALEVYLARRAAGMPVDTPGVRP